MLEILVVMAVLAILMAKRGRGKRAMGPYIRGNIEEDFSIGTLAGNTGAVQGNTDAVNGRTWLSSIKAIWSLSGVTLADNTGPLEVGIAHGDYTLAEIVEWITLSTGWDAGNLVSREIANRKIRRVGVFDTIGAGGVGSNFVLNEGRPIHTKLGWMLEQDQTVDYWVFNHGSVAFGTTDPNVHILGHANLWSR